MRLTASSTHNVFTVICVLIASAFLSHTSASSTTRNPVKSLYTLRNATIHTATKRVHALSHFDLSFILNAVDHVKLSLEPSHDIFPEGALVNYVDHDGQILRQEPLDRLAHKVFKGKAWTRTTGHDDWIPAGWARITVRKDGLKPLFEGIFSVDHDTHHIHMAESYLQTRHIHDPDIEELEKEHMVLYRDSDIHQTEELSLDGLFARSSDVGSMEQPSCMADDLHFNSMPEHPVHQEILRRSERRWAGVQLGSLFGKRQVDNTPSGGNSAGVNLINSIGQTAGCPTTRKVALVGVAADCNYRASFPDEDQARQNIISQMNQASNLWERTFNISLGLQNLTVFPPDCPGSPPANTPFNRACADDFDIQARLNAFSQWRGTLSDNNSHWTLLSTCPTQSAVGLAWLGQACVNQAQTANSSVTGNGQSDSGTETVAGANVVVRTRGASEWQVIAHETGHTFGAVHDCTSQSCQDQRTVQASQCCPLSASECNAGQRYMMNPSTSQGIQDFSPCSIGNICSALGRNSVRSSCLSDNRGVSTITGQQCGNGIVEPGEDCDPGGEDNACCDARTCRFRNGAVCDDSNEDCCNQCQFSSAGTVCRASTGECDPQETCSGTSPTCPADVNAPNGQSCGNGLQCASGQCTSRDQQCRTVMGSFTQNNDTYACDRQGCQLSCASPEFGRGTCYGLQQNFLDGTTCGGGGTCDNGRCRGASVGNQVRSWIDDNRNLVIGLGVGIGSLLLLAILTCLWRSIKRRRAGKKGGGFPPAGPPPGGWQGWNSRGPPPEYYGAGGSSSAGGSSRRGINRRPVPPPPLPPREMGMSGGNGVAPPPPLARRGTSVRYA